MVPFKIVTLQSSCIFNGFSELLKFTMDTWGDVPAYSLNDTVYQKQLILQHELSGLFLRGLWVVGLVAD